MKKLLLLIASAILSVSAIFAVPVLPSGYVSIYSLKPETERAPVAIAALTTNQLLGPGSGWGTATEYNLSRYEKLILQITFNAADAGKQFAVRFSSNMTTYAKIFTLPSSGTTYTAEILMADYDNTAGQMLLGGLLVYNGSTHWSFAYTGTPTANAITVEYAALKTIASVGLSIVPANEVQAQALPLGQSTTLNAVFNPTNTTNQVVTWSSGDENIATVNASGVVTASATTSGDVVITATSVENNLITATYTVTVVAAAQAVTGVTLGESTTNLKLGHTKTLVCTVEPANATDKNVTWASSDETVATVDATGTLTPLKIGETTITVTTIDGGFTATCVVTVVGYTPIPNGYVSLYTMTYNTDGTIVDLSTTTTFPGASVPGIFTSDTKSLLGVEFSWNTATRYCDLSNYSELKVGTIFKTEDIGKTFEFRYAFSTSTGSVITNRVVTIESENQPIVIDLNTDAGDTEDLKRLGAIKTRMTSSGVITFDVDYVAIKSISTDLVLSEASNPDSIVNVYSITGTLIRKNVKLGEATRSLSKGIYIVNNKKICVIK